MSCTEVVSSILKSYFIYNVFAYSLNIFYIVTSPGSLNTVH